jgi:diguanylate cyclase (GGDEF)-like protein
VVLACADPDIAEWLCELLEAMPSRRARVDLVSDSASALAAMAQGGHDLWIVDERLPDRDGIATVAIARTWASDTPALLVTAEPDPVTDARAIAAGFTDALPGRGLDAALLDRAVRFACARAESLRAARSAEARYARAVAAIGEGVWEFDIRSRLLTFDRTALALLGDTSTEPMSLDAIAARVHPEDLPAVLAAGYERRFELTTRLSHADGSWRSLRLSGWRVRGADADGRPRRALYAGFLSDVSPQQEAEAALRSSEASLRAIFQGSGIACALLDADGMVRIANPEAVRLGVLAWGVQIAPGLRATQLGERASKHVGAAMARARTGDHAAVDVQLGGAWFEVRYSAIRQSSGAFSGWCVTAHNVEERRRVARQVRHLATHDALTGLPNRLALVEAMASAGPRASVIALDLDRFNTINDGMGHAVGDELLTAIARRLSDAAPPGSLVARLDADEFAILVADADPGEVVARALDAVRAPLRIGSGELRVTASAGVARRAEVGASAEDLLRAACVAQYEAKSAGGDAAHAHRSELVDRAHLRMELEVELRRALARGELDVHYQPVMCLQTGRVLGMEALARWTHPRLGVVAPAAFVPVAEQVGLAPALTRLVLSRAAQQMAAWRARFPALVHARMSINLSARDLEREGLAARVSQVLARTGLPASSLTVELAESAAMRDPDMTVRALRALRDVGVDACIDDFGTGSSSLGRLHSLPVTTLKVDRSFVAETADGVDNWEIVESVVALARCFGLTTVAEGVETKDQAARLVKLGCGSAQGYHYAPPADAATTERWLATVAVA